MISVAVQSGSNVKVYNERNTLIFTKSGTLVGYTGSTVSVKTGSGNVQTFNERGTLISTH